MILTKDNLLRFVRDNKAIIPTQVAEAFETTTMIASAALSELAKDNLVKITHLKLSSSPYYYDPSQKECLVEIGLNHYSKYEKEVLNKLKDKEILPDNALTIQEKLAIEKIKDFAIPLDINVGDKQVRFWVWYLRNVDETKNQIMAAVSGGEEKKQESKKATKVSPKKEKVVDSAVSNSIEPLKKEVPQQNTSSFQNRSLPSPIQNRVQEKPLDLSTMNNQMNIKIEENQVELFIENFLRENYFKIESKKKEEKGILYTAVINLGKIEIEVDCFYFYKKTNEAELIKFYSSSMKPKIVFIEKCPKKIFNLANGIPNLTVVNI